MVKKRDCNSEKIGDLNIFDGVKNKDVVIVNADIGELLRNKNDE